MLDRASDMDHAAADSPESQRIGEEIGKFPNHAALVDPFLYIDDGTPSFLIMHGD